MTRPSIRRLMMQDTIDRQKLMIGRLAEYARHNPDCPVVQAAPYGRSSFAQCSCGFASLLKDIRESGLTIPAAFAASLPAERGKAVEKLPQLGQVRRAQ